MSEPKTSFGAPDGWTPTIQAMHPTHLPEKRQEATDEEVIVEALRRLGCKDDAFDYLAQVKQELEQDAGREAAKRRIMARLPDAIQEHIIPIIIEEGIQPREDTIARALGVLAEEFLVETN